MANVAINDLTLKATVDSTDEIELQETGGGSSRKTTTAGIRVTKSQVTDLVPCYGELYENNPSGTVITLTTGGTYYGWVSATQGIIAGSGYMTSDVADGTADHLTVGASGAGIYQCVLTCSFSGTNSSTFTGAVHVNGSESTIRFSRLTATTATRQVAAASGLLSLSSSDEVSWRIKAAASTKTATVYNVNLSLHRIVG